ncbi:hypothetical protein DB346_10275 [Verrucomicrobia bacterium LW23]|nr:hypothetical protein DB346_10275 [Verrucomicrobia bacterium LW23]
MAAAPSPEFRFEAACSVMEARLAEWEAWERGMAPRGGGAPGARVAVLVAPWLQTGVPFFSLEVALRLRQMGCRVTLLFDAADLTFNRYSGFGDECALLEHLVGSFSRHFPVVRVDTLPITPQSPAAVGDDTFWSRLLFENAVLTLRGEAAGRNYMAKHPALMTDWRQHSRLVMSVLQPRLDDGVALEGDTAPGVASGTAAHPPYDWVFLPESGLGLTGIYIRVMNELGMRYTTCDFAAGELAVCMDGVAAFFDDLPGVLRTVMPTLDDENWATIQRCTEQELDDARHGRDGHDVESGTHADPDGRNLDEELESDVLLCLSYRPETALVLRQCAFASAEAWIRAVIAWAKANRRYVIVRQHPCESLPEYLGTDDYAEMVADADPSGNVARYVAADDEISTYALVERTQVVLPFSSRIGVEAGIMGKPVLLGLKCFYSGFGFTEAASTPKDYFADLDRMLKEATARKVPVAQEDNRKARFLYFLLGVCAYLENTFTPMPEDCVAWMATPPRQLWETTELADLTEALLEHRPLSEVRCRRALSAGPTFRASFQRAPR